MKSPRRRRFWRSSADFRRQSSAFRGIDFLDFLLLPEITLLHAMCNTPKLDNTNSSWRNHSQDSCQVCNDRILWHPLSVLCLFVDGRHAPDDSIVGLSVEKGPIIFS